MLTHLGTEDHLDRGKFAVVFGCGSSFIQLRGFNDMKVQVCAFHGYPSGKVASKAFPPSLDKRCGTSADEERLTATT
ncbi:hypothetical protein RSAG8_11479, partial [Rhizoctonia solani AG-8 WAC10335]